MVQHWRRHRLWFIVVVLFVTLFIITLKSLPQQQSIALDRLTESQQDPVPAASWLDSVGFTPLSTEGWSPASKQFNVHGNIVMSELGNATIRAELGRSAWRVLHTMASRFPKRPTGEEQEALRAFIYLFARLYPCGQCAKHFQVVLRDHPPATTSRVDVEQWACRVHNVVNERLEKPQFNCSTVQDHWQCGCADADADDDDNALASTTTIPTLVPTPTSINDNQAE